MQIADNPFKVLPPEGLDADEMMDLFFQVPYLQNIQDTGNSVLNGPRGSGKSMLLRYLKPDCQMAARNISISELPFFAVLISIKKAVNLTELRRLEDFSARTALGEHALATYTGAQLFESLLEIDIPSDERDCAAVREMHGELMKLMAQSGGQKEYDNVACGDDFDALLRACKGTCEDAYANVNYFAKKLVFSARQTYEGPLCDYLTFLYPILKSIKSLPFMPRNRPIYLMFDDADHLGDDQARVLNSWLVARTQEDVSMKVAVQSHRTLATVDGGHVRAPHDFQQINMADVYTTKRGRVYFESVHGIVKKRLQRAGISASPEDFFPPDLEQEAAIKRIGEEIRSKHETEGRGYRASDDVLRYARPEYMKRLAGQSKSVSSFCYAGFGELVHISSGQVRFFLEPAAKMFGDQQGRERNDAENIAFIETGVQSKVLREEANGLMFGDFDELRRSTQGPDGRANIDRLRNLVQFLGGFFWMKLISNDSERRVFSLAVTGGPEQDIEEVLNLGVHQGYFHSSSLGNKEGTGRVRLYVLSRRLAPHFNLDPSSFAGYQFFTNGILRQAIVGPERVLSFVRRRGLGSVSDDNQRELF